jgi:hypothetical protein
MDGIGRDKEIPQDKVISADNVAGEGKAEKRSWSQ